MSRISPHALVSAVVRVRAMDLTQKERLAEAEQVREVLMSCINPPFTA